MTKFKFIRGVNRSIVLVLFVMMVLSSCVPSQEITKSWINREALPKGPFKSVFILALVPNDKNRIVIEDQLEKVLKRRGMKVVRTEDIFPSGIKAKNEITKEQLADALRKAGCDAVFTLALINVKTEKIYDKNLPTADVPKQFYNSTIEYFPIGFGFYGSYYNYLSNYAPQVYSADYYATERTFFLETNFYELSSDQLLWSIKSKAVNPSDVKSWFNGYSKLMIKKLKEEGLIKK